MISRNSLIHGDCLEVMSDIQDHSVDMILCDLPYGVLNKSNPEAKWDSVIDFDKLWNQYKRIIKPDGAIVLFGQGVFTAKLMMSNLPWWKYNLIWDKILKSSFLNANRQPLRQHEDICIFCSGQTIYNPQMVFCEPRYKNHRNHKIGGCLNENIKNSCYGNFGAIINEITNEKYPSSIISVPKPLANGKCYHPTEKPVTLLEYLIMTYSNEGDLVLDNTMGSGSTCVAAINANRDYIGIELNEKYYNIAVKRVKENKRQLKLF